MALSSDAGRASVSSITKLVNLYPEKNASESENPVALLSTPGLDLLFKIEDEGGIVCGIENALGSFFATRKGFYQIKGSRYLKKATVSLVGRASIATNGLSIMIVDGYKAYAYDIGEGVLSEVNIPRSNTVVFVDGYFIVAYNNSNQFAVSKLYSTEFDPIDFAAAEGSPDNIQGIALLKRQLYILGEKSTEVWYSSGEDFPFNPNQSAYIDIGCYNKASFTYSVNGVCWLGDDKIIYLATGYIPQRISTHAIEYLLNNVDCSEAFMSGYSQEGHDFVALMIPSEKIMLFYDMTSGVWHFRESEVGVYQSLFMLGSNSYAGAADGSVYLMNPDSGMENGKTVERYCITPSISSSGGRFRVSCIEMIVQYFRPTNPTKLESDMTALELMLHRKDGEILMSYSDDDGVTWTNESAASPSGTQGKYRWHKLGITYRRAFKFRSVSKLACVWAGVSIG
jgi:hypothetical protein